MLNRKSETPLRTLLILGWDQFLPRFVLPVGPKRTPAQPAAPVLAIAQDAASSREPRTPTEIVIAGIWVRLLGVDRVGLDDNFFGLGGHSLLAVRMISRVRARLQVELPLRAVFKAPTLAALAARVDKELSSGVIVGHGPIPPANRSRELPLSFAQERLWFLNQLHPGTSDYNDAWAVELPSGTEVDVLERALVEIVRRHEALRTAFVAGTDGPVQRILPPESFRVARVDLSALADDERETAAARLVAEEARRPFDVERGPLLRTTLLRWGEGAHTLVVVLHDAASDDWSVGVFLRELAELYAAFRRGLPSPLAEPEVQYADFAAWQRDKFRGDKMERQLGFWRERLHGAPTILDLPTDRPRPAVQDFAGATHHFVLSPAAAAATRELSAREGTTRYIVLVAAFAAVLHRWSGQDDLVLGAPIANRVRTELEGVIGCFSSKLPMRVGLSAGTTFRELLARVRDTVLEAVTHQDVPFERLLNELEVERSLSHPPLFQIVIAMFNTASRPLELEGFAARCRSLERGTSLFDLTVVLDERDDGLGGTAKYATALFDQSTIERLVSHLDALLCAAWTLPDAPVYTLEMVDAWEHAAVVEAFNRTERGGSTDTLVHQRVAAQAVHTPGAVALELAGERLTYAEVEARANRLARRLAALGVGPDSRVAVCMERSPELPIAVLSVLKAGGAYVAIHPCYPADRIQYMIRDSGAAVLITTSDVAALLPAVEATVLRLDEEAERIACEPAVPLDVAVDADNLCYVLYTSGSTGIPKGAALPHRALANLLRWQVERATGPAAARTLQFASLCFDVSFQEIFGAWTTGGTVVLVDEETRRDAERLLAYLRDERVERLFLPFAALQNLAEVAEGADARLPYLREVVTAGEALRSTHQLRAFFRVNPGVRLDNHYGPSETHVVSAYRLGEDPDEWPLLPPIGAPIDNVRLYVLDAALRPVPLGVRGEVYAGGACLARSYLGRPALTAERFVPDPFSAEPGARLYRTGDRARWTAGGELEYIGRTDFQVKVRGFRVEPGEVEAALGEYATVRAAAVTVRGEGAEKQLVAYVVPVDGAVVSPAELRAHLAGRLPDYMVPSTWVALESMPLTPSGKVDRRALPTPQSVPNAGGVEPRTETEEMVARIWAELLGMEQVGVEDNFFEIGGHSLLLTRMVEMLRERMHVHLSLRDAFVYTTVEALAAHIEGRILAELESLGDEELAAALEDEGLEEFI